MAKSMPFSKISDQADSLAEYLATLQTALQPPTRASAELPAPSDIAFHRSIDKKVAASLDAEASNIKALIQSVSNWACKKGLAKGTRRAADEDENSDEDGDGGLGGRSYARLADIVDNLLEKADICMDEYSGNLRLRKLNGMSAEASSSSSTLAPAASVPESLPKTGRLPPQILNAQMEPPQRRFSVKPNNKIEEEWDRPLTMGKPHALVPIDWKPPPTGRGESILDPGLTRQGLYCAEGDPRRNPYYYEIFNSSVPSFVYQAPSSEELQPPPPLDPEVPFGVSGVSFKWIDDEKSLSVLAKHLQEDRVKEIAIDLEAHAFRSYQGIACLMQLSTRWGDFILDLLSDTIRNCAEKLNAVLTNPNKIKILHGAEHDVLWLQRDCGLYLVNLFDTYHVTNVLGFPGHSLAYLLSKYYDFEADKRYQLADWRIRPLPKEMLYYARSDTHSLIYVYHRLRLEILATGGKQAMDEVFRRSKITAARRYAKEVWDEEGNSREGWRTLWRRMGGEEARETDLRTDVKFMGKTERLLRRLHRWRDDVAREEDESPRYILSAAKLINLASRSPMTKSEAMAIFTPGIQPLRKRAGQVANIIKTEVLAWEQDQKDVGGQRRADLVRQGATQDTTSEMDEDIGSVVEAVPASTSALSSQAATPSEAHKSAMPVIWKTDSSVPGTPLLLRSKQSSLFGGEICAGPTSTTVTPTLHSTSATSVHRLLLSDLTSLIGSACSSLLSARAAPEKAALSDAGETTSTSAPEAAVVESHTSIGKDSDGLWKSTGGSNGAMASSGASGVAAEADEPMPAENDEVDDDEGVLRNNEGSVVQVKKKKTKWSAARKRKAKEQRALASATHDVDNDGGGFDDDNSKSVPKKKRRANSGQEAAIESFDYSSAPSILDARRPPRPALAAASGKGSDEGMKSSKGHKKKPEKSTAASSSASGPERFAYMRQPKDRTNLAANVGKSITFK